MLDALKLPELRKKILFTFFIIIIFRFLAHVPVPGVNVEAIKSLVSSNDLLGLYNVLSGGGFKNFSIITLGLGPYINASIIIQLFTSIIPKLEALTKEGEAGKQKINQYTRILTIPIAILQGYGMYFLLNKSGVIPPLNPFSLLILIATFTAGAMVLVWLGDLVTEYGVGNGISLLIFVGIISTMPLQIYQFLSTAGSQDIFMVGAFIVLTLAVVIGVILVNEGIRNIPIEYGRRGTKSQKITNYLPIKINQAGVIPIIFAVSVVLLPAILAGPLIATGNSFLVSVGQFLAKNYGQHAFLYNFTYFWLVVGFTFFYTFVQFNPEKVSDDIKKNGGFIPGIRPGKATKDYLQSVVIKLTLFGSAFLGIIAILPYLLQLFTNINSINIGGTSLLIVVSVVLETVRQIQSYTVSRSYKNYLD